MVESELTSTYQETELSSPDVFESTIVFRFSLESRTSELLSSLLSKCKRLDSGGMGGCTTSTDVG